MAMLKCVQHLVRLIDQALIIDYSHEVKDSAQL